MSHIIVTTGPESSGKTTLAGQLAECLLAPLVEEASRAYLTLLYKMPGISHYQQSDLLEIANIQYQAEKRALLQKPDFIVCDTDLLVIMIWSEVKYGGCDEQLLQLFERSLQLAPRSYLLCDPEIPWQTDPLRENPDDRDSLYQRYQNKLQQLTLTYHHVNGDEQTRLQHSLKLCKM